MFRLGKLWGDGVQDNMGAEFGYKYVKSNIFKATGQEKYLQIIYLMRLVFIIYKALLFNNKKDK